MALGLPSGFIIMIAVVMGLFQYLFSDKLVLMTTGARVVEYDEAPELHHMIEKLCMEADLPKPRIAVMHSPMPNAFATGRSPHHAVVAVTDSIMQTLNRDDLRRSGS
jgi:heat shock protein HtpX